MLAGAVSHIAGAHQAGAHAAAHALLHGYLAGNAELLGHLGYVAQHGLGTAGQHSVIVVVLAQLLAHQGIHKAVVTHGAVVGGHEHLGALILKTIGQDDLVLRAAAQNSGGFSAGILSTAQHGRDTDAAAHQQIAALGLHGKAVASQSQHVQSVANGAVGQPLGAFAPDLKDDGQKVLRLILLAGAHGNGTAQKQSLTALDMDKLAGGLEGGADHVAALQRHIDGVSHLLFGDDFTFAFYFHRVTPLSDCYFSQGGLPPCRLVSGREKGSSWSAASGRGGLSLISGQSGGWGM